VPKLNFFVVHIRPATQKNKEAKLNILMNFDGQIFKKFALGWKTAYMSVPAATVVCGRGEESFLTFGANLDMLRRQIGKVGPPAFLHIMKTLKNSDC